NGSLIDIEDSNNDNETKDYVITDINSDTDKNSNDKNNLRANALGDPDGTGNTFSDLQILIDGASGTLSLTMDYVFDEAVDGAYVNGINIGHTITIDGNGHTIDGNNLARIFAVNAVDDSQTIILNNLVLINGQSDSDGGAISWTGSHGAIENTIFENNSAMGSGGAVYINGDYAVLNNNIFLSNTASRQGGAVYIKGNNAVIDKSTFTNHTAQEEGGAIYVDGLNTIIGNSTFNNNTSWDDGGAITWNGDFGKIYNITCFNNSGIGNGHTSSGGTISIYGSDITMDKINITLGFVTETDSSRSAKGGGMFVTGNNVNITNIEFTDCFTNSTADDSSGGAMYVIGDNTNIVNATFTNNHATEDGGSVFIEGENCTLNNSVFINSVAHNDGGAIEWRGDYGRIYNLTADNCYADSVQGSSKGGSLLVTGDSMIMDCLNISNSHVSGETYTGSNTIQGGGIYLTGNDCNLTNIEFTNCSADFDGDDTSAGALYVLGDNANIVNASFTNCSATEDGGSVFIEGDYCTLNNSVFINSVAHNDGGAIEWQGDYGSIYNLTADNCYADSAHGSSKGGSLLITGDNMLIDEAKVYNSHVSGETYTGSNAIQGGGIYLTGNDCNITNSAFENCSVDYERGDASGGALYVIGNNTNVINTSVENSHARFGGAVYWLGENGYADNLTASSNNASQHGGAVYWSGSDGTIVNSNFSKNNSTLNGSALYLSGNDVLVSNSVFDDNYAINGSAAFYCIGHGCEAIDSNFSNNLANKSGGALYWNSGNAGDLIDGCIFTNNTSLVENYDTSKTNGGGAVYWSQGGDGGIIRNSEFYNNSVHSPGSGLGGAVIWDHSYNGLIDNCTFIGNYVTTDKITGVWVQAGAVYWRSRNGTISNSYFSECYTDKEAGAIYWSDQDSGYDANSHGQLINCTFESNYAKALGEDNDNYNLGGGAVLVKESLNVEFINCSFINNTHPRYGGALTVANSANNVSLDGCTFINNTSPREAGALRWMSVNGTVNNSTFINNTASLNGGAVVWSAVNGIIDNSTFENNSAGTYGGAISWNSQNGTVNNSTFVDNSAGTYGGAVVWNANNGLIDNSTFENNSAGTTGGAVDWENSNGFINNTIFANNNASTQGGALYVKGNNINMDNSTFANNTAGTYAGAVFWREGYIHNSVFENNTALMNVSSYNNIGGGALFSLNGNVEILNSSFTNNSIPFGMGGAVLLTGSNVVINDSEFYNNSITGTYNTFKDESLGGAVWITGQNAKVDYSTFEGNAVHGTNKWLQGGALGLTNNNGIVNNSYFADNYCEHEGGALYLASAGAIVHNSTFISNVANGTADGSNGRNDGGFLGGGAIYLKDRNNMVVEDCIIANNSAKTGAGILADTNNQVKFINCTIENNTGLNGAGVYAISGTNNFTDCEFNNNVATGKGGGILIQAATNFNNVSFFNNTAENGGAIYINTNNNNLLLSNFVALNNTASLGGAIYVAVISNNREISNATMQYNKANNGSAIYYAPNNVLNLANVVLLDNQALAYRFTDIQGTVTDDSIEYSVLFEGGDNLLNSIYNANTNSIYYTNVTYWSVLNNVGTVVNTGETRITATKRDPVSGETGIFQSLREAGQNVTFILYDSDNNVVYNVTGVTDIAGNVTFNYEGQNVLSMPIRVIHYEDDYYTEISFATKNMTNVIIEVNNITYGDEELVNITVIPVNESAEEIPSGNISIYINDELYGNYTLDEDGTYQLSLPDLEVGSYTIRVEYKGDLHYLPELNETEFNVVKADSHIDVSPQDIIYNQIENITVSLLDNNASGKLVITITNKSDDTQVIRTLEIDEFNTTEGIVYPFEGLAAGNYTVKVVYSDDHNYLDSEDSADFEVAQADPNLREDSPDIIYGDDENITVLIDGGATGTITVKIGDEIIGTFTIAEDNITEDDKKIVFSYEKPLPGIYGVSVFYEGSNNYYNDTVYGEFTVSKAVPELIIDVDNIFVGDNEIINITVVGPDGALLPTGNVTVLVRAYNETLILNATAGASFTLENEVEGTDVTVVVFYNGDDNYNATIASTSYNVTKRNTTTVVSGQTPIAYGDIENLTITVNETDVSGTIIVYVNSTKEGFENITKVIDIVDGNVVQWNIDEKVLPAGEYTVTAIYSGDSKYNGSNGTYIFVVDKITDYEITVEANNTVYGEDEIIIVTVPDDATGNVVLVSPVLGQDTLTEQIVDGKAIFNVTGLQVGEYGAEVIYHGDSNYAGDKEASDPFNVTKAESEILVIPTDIEYTEDEPMVIDITVSNASGKVNVTIINKATGEEVDSWIIDSIVSGETSIVYDEKLLDAGNYTVTVEFYGDHNYNNSTDSKDFEVRKVNPDLSEVSPDIVYGEDETITVTISGVEGGLAPTGTIEVKVDGETIKTITIGEEDLEYVVIKPGADLKHNITVIYSGDGNYNEITITGEFAVGKNSTFELEETSPDIVYGNNETITITLPNDATGTVYLVVNGTYYTPIGIDENHRSVFNIVAPIVGNYNFTAFYSGDGNYTANNISGAFNVAKANVTLEETHTATITYGADNSIAVTITGVEGPEGVLAPTGTIKVLVDGNEIGNLTIGEELVFTSIKPFVDSQHNITVIYSGDNNYNDKTISDGVFEVVQNTSIEISENSPDIVYGDDETITVTIAGDATGTITVKIGEEIVGTFTIAEDNITEDNKIIEFTKVKPDGGVYNDLVVEYGGDNNYASRTLEGNFTVSPIEPEITEESPDIVYGNNENIIITVPEGATGTITVSVKNSKDELIVDGVILTIGEDDLEVSIVKPDADNYTISIEYSGCANYTAKNITGEFEVTKAVSQITVVPTNITYGQTETITVTVPEGATGDVTITIGTYTDTLTIEEGSNEIVFTIPKTEADALLNVNENYIVFANYSGDGNYESAVSNAPFHVDPANTTLTIEVENITYGEDEIINVTVNGVPNGDVPAGFVTITIEGTDISLTKRVDGEGKVQFNVTGLTVGEYTVNATFESSSINYNDSNASAEFNVIKADVKVENRNITAINITYGEDETITVILNENNITGNVTITINGTPIDTKSLEDGKAVFVIPSSLVSYLEANEYNVIANYSGDDNYNGFTVDDNLNADFKVDKADVTVEVNPVDIIYKETEEINVTVAGVVIDGDASDIISKYNLTGKVTIYIDGVENQTKEISAVDENGVLHFYVEGLAVGMHNVTAKYWDDRNYNDNDATEKFEVINALPENMQVIPQNITYHIEDEIITVDLGEVLNGTIQLYINDTLVATFDVIDQSSVTYTNTVLAVGNYTTKAIFTANGDSVEASANFTVSKAPTTVTVEAENSTYGSTQTITVTVDNYIGDEFNLTGNVNITINGVDYGSKTVDANGQAVFTIDGLEANDNYVVIANYYNDVNYLDNSGNVGFKVDKANVTADNRNITAVNITYGDDETITVTLNENNITGKVTITINGTQIETKELENGKAVFTVPDLEVNGYNVVANYSGDTNYNPFTIEDNLNTDFVVEKANSTIDVTAIASIVYGNNETITVTVPIRNHTGTITLTINGTDYQFIKQLTAEDGDTIVLSDVSGLAVGNYNITVTYTDDRNYKDSVANALFEVIKSNPVNLTVEATNVTYGEDVTVTVTVPDDATGNVTISIGTYTATKEITPGVNTVEFAVPDLEVNNYVVYANYSGDSNYESGVIFSPFHVDQANSTVIAEAVNITYGDDETITVTVVSNNATGWVTLSINGSEIGSKKIDADGKAVFTVKDLEVGEYEVTVVYDGDRNYIGSDNTTNFTVSKADIGEENITVVPTNITYLDDETIVVSVDVPNATGKVTIRINGTDVVLSKNITEDGSQSVSFTVPGLVVGDYNVTVEYSDDANYNDINASALFTVSPEESSVVVVPTNITYNDDETITVTVPITNATGKVTITINGTEVDMTEAVNSDGVATFTVPGLVVGEYNVTAKYHDDPNYNDSESSALFHVDKDNISDMNVNAANITYGDDETVTITIGDNNATGNITIKINGTEYGPQELVDGSTTFTVPGLVAGDYEVEVTYSGDDNYNATTADAEFTVDKATPNVFAVGTNITYGSDEQITAIVVGDNITGNVTVFIDGNEIDTIELTPDGRAVLNVPGLSAGDHVVKVVYNGDDNHYANEGEDNFNVKQAKPAMDINTTNIDYHEVENITVILPEDATGTVNVTVTGDNGVTQTFTDVPVGEDGTVTIPVENLPAGNYNVTVNYSGDENYTDANGTAQFSISKIDSTVDVNTANITYGEDETIKYTLPEDATGTVNVTVTGDNGVTQTFTDVPIENGTIGITLADLLAGNYSVTVEYGGDDNYNPSIGESEFSVSRAESSMEINTTDIDYHETENIKVNVTGVEGGVTPTGTVNVTVTGDNGVTETFTDVPVGEDGTVTIPVENLPAGNYTVTVDYSGDDNYDPSTGTGSFEVSAIDSFLDVNTTDIVYGDEETITIKVPSDATGTVNVTVTGDNGVTETFTDLPIGEDGTVSVPLENLPAGKYDVKVDYSGDDNYNPATADAEFTVDKATPNVIVIGTDITYGWDEFIIAQVIGDNVTGNVTVFIDGNEIDTLELTHIGTGGRAELDVPGLAAGDHVIKVVYNGDANYYPNEGEDTFTVSKAESGVDINVTDIDYHESENIVINVTGVEGGVTPTGTVNVTVTGDNGVTKTFTDLPVGEDGTVSVPVENLPAGNYDVTVNYSGDENYTSSSGEAEFEVSKIDSPVDIDVDDITYGETENVEITLPSDATGTVDVTVTDEDGNEWTFTNLPVGEDGTVSVPVENLPAGDYEVTVTYSGDDNYNPATEKATFSVDKAEPTVDIDVSDIDYHDTENIVIDVSGVEDGVTPTGTVNVTVTGDNGVTRTFTDLPVGEDGTVSVPVEDLPAGNYDVTVNYSGDDNYDPATGKDSFSVGLIDTPIDLDTEDIVYGDDETITVTLPDDATGDVTITIKDKDGSVVKTETLPIGEDGTVELTVPELNAGNYTVQVDYPGDDNYKPNTVEGEFEVAKANATVEIHVYDIIYGDIEELTVTCNAPGTVTIYVNGAEVTLPLDNGYAHIVFASALSAYSGNAQWDLENLAVGTYPASVHYNGNENYNEADDDDVFHVIKANTTTKVSVDDIKVGEDAVINVEVTHESGSEKINTNITVTVDGKEYTVELTDGKGSLTVPGLKAGKHTVKAVYPGSHNYTDSSDSETFNVLKHSPTVEVTPEDIIVRDDEHITVSVPEDATGKVTIEVDGKKYTADVKDGKAEFDIPGLKAGKYTVKATYGGDEKYLPGNATAKFTVSKVDPEIKTDAPTIKEGEDGKITVILPEDATGKVTIEVDGKKYTADVKDGKAVFNIPGLDVGKHHIKVYYSGDDKYNAAEVDGGDIEVLPNNESDHQEHTDGGNVVHLETYATGNPILVLLLAFVFLGFIPLRRKKDDEEDEE
ncbi:Ig-like domain repeat protein, partial [Methanobrevibacter sp.]